MKQSNQSRALADAKLKVKRRVWGRVEFSHTGWRPRYEVESPPNMHDHVWAPPRGSSSGKVHSAPSLLPNLFLSHDVTIFSTASLCTAISYKQHIILEGNFYVCIVERWKFRDIYWSPPSSGIAFCRPAGTLATVVIVAAIFPGRGQPLSRSGAASVARL